jgi:hypothetical protein
VRWIYGVRILVGRMRRITRRGRGGVWIARGGWVGISLHWGNMYWLMFVDKPTACCDDHHHTKPTQSRTPLLYCFSSLPAPTHDQSYDKCLDPIPLLTNPYPGMEGHNSPTRARCSSSNPCGGGEECVRLREDERILRITFRDDRGGREEVVLWSGPRVEVLEQGSCLLFFFWIVS